MLLLPPLYSCLADPLKIKTAHGKDATVDLMRACLGRNITESPEATLPFQDAI
jgi:hypothetical protein